MKNRYIFVHVGLGPRIRRGVQCIGTRMGLQWSLCWGVPRVPSAMYSPRPRVSRFMSYSLNTRGCVPVHARCGTCLILSVCRGNLTFKSHWILSKLMENSFIHLFIPYVRNELFFGTIRLLGLLAGLCKLQSVVVRISLTFVFIMNKANLT